MIKQRKDMKNGQGLGAVKGSLSGQVEFEWILERHDGVSLVTFWRKSIPGRGDSECKFGAD